MQPTTDKPQAAPQQGTEPLPGQIGRYRILEPCAAGGMGTVYKAHDPQLDRVVALKLPRFEGPERDLAVRRQRFQREARAAAQVWHPHVCPIFDVGEHKGQPFVVMAYLEGPSLAERLAASGRFENVGEAVLLVRQLLDALAAVHARGIIHRDLKPANVVIDPAGRAILTDFGLARPEQDAEHLTSEGLVVGTPAYMAPEQAAGQAERIGPWTDLYSLGVVFYQMLTGRLPFEGPGLTIFAKILNATAAAPSSLRPELSGDLDTIVRKAMAKEEKDRYQEARQFDADLAVWCQNHPVDGGILAATAIFPSPQPLATIGSSAEDTPLSSVGHGMRRRTKIVGLSILGGTFLLVLVLLAGMPFGWFQTPKVVENGEAPRPAAVLNDVVKKDSIEGMRKRKKESVEDIRKRKEKEEDLAVRLDAALAIQFRSDKDQALAKVAGDAAQVGLVDLVKKGIAEIGPLNKDDAAADCAEKLARAGHKKAAMEVAQMIGSLFKRDAALKKVALEPN
jgi:tRNA A-37 threonylcarbamoyl transferase component Bud32